MDDDDDDNASFSFDPCCCPAFRGERYSHLVFRQPAPGVLTIAAPWRRFDILPYGAVTVVFELPSPSRDLVAVVGGPPLDPPTEDALAACFGSTWWKRLKWIVAPSAQAAQGLRSWVRAFREAVVLAPEGLGFVTWGLRVRFRFSPHSCPTLPPALAEHLTLVPFRTSSAAVELVVFHRASGTLYQSDLLLNLPANDAFTKVGRPWLSGLLVRSFRPGGWLQRHRIKSFGRSRSSQDRVKQDALAIATLPFTCIVPCHGDVVDANAQAVWRAVFGLDPAAPLSGKESSAAGIASSASSIAKVKS